MSGQHMPDIQIPEHERRRRRRLRRLTGLIALGVALVIVILALVLFPGGVTATRRDLLVATVRSGKLTVAVRAPGILKPMVYRWATAVVPGVVERLEVQPGDLVESNSVIAVLSNPELNAALVSARSTSATAEANLVSLRAQLQNQLLTLQSALANDASSARAAALKVKAQSGLLTDHVVPRIEYERSRLQASNLAQQVELIKQRIVAFRSNITAQIAAEQGKVDAVNSALAEARAQVASLTVTAGLSGVVQSVAVQPGQTLSFGGSIARVASVKRVKAVLQVPPSEAVQVVVGQPVRVTLDVPGQSVVAGTVARVAPSVVDGSVDVDVKLPDILPGGSRPNLSVSGVITVTTLPRTLYVQRPIYSRPESAQRLYRLVDDGSAAVPVQVRFGQASYRTIQVLAGLRAGDRIIVSDTSAFAGASRVRLR